MIRPGRGLPLFGDAGHQRPKPLKVAIDVRIESTKRDNVGLNPLRFDFRLQLAVATHCRYGVGQRPQYGLRRLDRRQNAVPGSKMVIDAPRFRRRYLDRVGHRLVGPDRERAQAAVLQEGQASGSNEAWIAPLNMSEMILELTV